VNLPKPVSVQWLRELIDMAVTARSSEFLVRRIERDAQLLLMKGVEQPQMFWLVRAFTSFLRGEREECARCADAAYRLAQDDVVILANVASLLADIGEPRLAAVYAQRLARSGSDDPMFMIRAARVFSVTLNFEAAAEIMRSREVQSLVDQRPSILKDEAVLRDIEVIVNIFRPADVDVEQRIALLETAISAISSEGFTVRRVKAMHYPYDNSMRYELFVDASSGQSADLSTAIAEVIVTSFEEDRAELITFSCRPLASYELSEVVSQLSICKI
jgi:hypothetical protein